MVQLDTRFYGQSNRSSGCMDSNIQELAMASSEVCQDCRRRASMDTNSASQRKAGDLREFFSNLRIKEDRRYSDGAIKNDKLLLTSVNAVLQWPSMNLVNEDCGSVATDAFLNFGERIRDCGGGKSYMYGPILPPSGRMIEAIVLSAWDNIIGPKAVFVWCPRDGEEKCEVFNDVQDAVEYTVSHTLHGELGKLSGGSTAARGLELYVAKDHGFIISSIPFTAPNNQESVPYSLSTITPVYQIGRFFDLHSLFNLWMQRLSCCLRVYLHQNAQDYKIALAELSPVLVEFCELLGSLSTSGLLSAEVPFVFCIDVDFEQKISQTLLEKAITSHLQTCCCSVVVGDSKTEINWVIRILANFLKPKERALVRLACEDKIPLPYHPGLLVQGMLRGVCGDVNITAEDVLCNFYPTTIVDLSQGEVRQSWLLNEHTKYRTARLKQELASLLTSSKPCPAMMQNIFHKVSEPSPLVVNFIEKIWPLECENQQRQGLVKLFMRRLEYHAFALVKLVQAALKNSSNLTDSTHLVNRKVLRRQLDLESKADFLVILAVAEKLHPGVYHATMQDSSTLDEGSNTALTVRI